MKKYSYLPSSFFSEQKALNIEIFGGYY